MQGFEYSPIPFAVLNPASLGKVIADTQEVLNGNQKFGFSHEVVLFF